LLTTRGYNKVLEDEARLAMARVTLEDIEVLHHFMQNACFKYGDFTLSSGRRSRYYYQGKRATFRPKMAKIIGDAVLDLIEEVDAEAVGGLEIGANPIADAVGRSSLTGRKEILIFTVRKEQKAHGTRERVPEASLDDWDEPLLKRGRRVVIVDDVITTGGSIETAIEVVETLGCEVVMVVALVERHERGGDVLRQRGYNFQRLFYTNEEGCLFVDEAFQRRIAGAAPQGVLRR
jgi:orotate phosphoribosyltransferase